MSKFKASSEGVIKVRQAIARKALTNQSLAESLDLTRTTIQNFLSQKFVENYVFIAICEKLELNIDEILEEIKPSSKIPNEETFSKFIDEKRNNLDSKPSQLSEPKPSVVPAAGSKEEKKGLKNPMLDSSYTQKFPNWIENKISRFVGREYVFNAFKDFTNQHKRGYFSVIGEPGEGKSTIVAKYVLDNPCAYYFNSRPKKHTSTAQFQEYICKQLIDHYNLELSFSVDKTKDGAFLQEVLAQISACLQDNEKLIIVVDALDEADLTPHQREGSIALYLPEEDLPDKVYFLLTWRRDKNIKPLLPSRNNVPSKIFDLKNDVDIEEECNKDIREYIQNYFNEVETSNELKTILDNSTLQKTKFLKGLTDKSKRNFMYLTLVLPAMVNGAYKDLILEELKKDDLKELKLTSLPDDLNIYYKDHWVRMGMISDQPPLDKIYIIYVMSENGIPMSRSLIAKYSGQKELIVQWVLDRWDQFLEVEPIIVQNNPDYRPLGYAFYHETYNDFLYSQEIIQSAGIDLKKLNAEVADREMPPDIET